MPIGQAHNDSFSANSQEIPVSVDNVCPERTEDQYVTSPSGESLGGGCSCPHQYNPVFGAAREWKNYTVASIVYMIQDKDLSSNIDTDDILFLLDEWDAENCIDTPSTFHMIEYYALKNQSHDPDTPTYMEALSGESSEEYFKAMDDEIQSLMIRYTWEIVSRK